MNGKHFFERGFVFVEQFFRGEGLLFKRFNTISVLITVCSGIAIVISFFADKPVLAGIFGIAAVLLYLYMRYRRRVLFSQSGDANKMSQPSLPDLDYLADENVRMAKSYYEQRNYPEALKCYKKAYDRQTQALETALSKGETGEVQNRGRADILLSKGVMHG
ncbi:MAG: tetratricopeptide repeat protein, partial [Azoarcus sp.]|nr:tetratricopeptide repeat protein [Azoarcus sp.]